MAIRGQRVLIRRPEALETVADATVGATASQLVGRDRDRDYVMITNTDSAETIRVGGSDSVTASRGTPIGPGETATLEGTFPVYAIREGSSDVTVAISYARFSTVD